MLYADDLILLAESASDLQIQMDLLSEYAKKWNLEINISKTKVLIFNKSNKTSGITWSIDNEIVEEVDSYTCLGVIFQKNGSFKKHVNELKDKGRKCLFSLIARNKEWRDLGPSLFLHVFDKTLVPILDYGGEIWGIYDWEELERTHLFACKHILNANMNTATNAIYAETGRTPLVAKRHVAAIKFAIRLSRFSSDERSKKRITCLF